MKYIILDWAGNHKISTETFDSFEDAWDCILSSMPEATDEELGEFWVVEATPETLRKRDRFLDPKDPRSESA